jgi:hypothetical protein
MTYVRICFSLLILLLGALTSASARASFGDCNSTEYLTQFDPRLASERYFLCLEGTKTPVVSAAGTTHIRVVQHLLADWAARPGALSAINNGIAASTRAMRTIGTFRITDVTILLIDGYAPEERNENFGEIAAWTNFSPGDTECRIAVWLLGAGASARNVASVVAHELFHCIQGASLSFSQMATGNGGRSGGGTWWIEGSADWFSTVAVSPPSYMRGRVRTFDATSSDTPLNRMTYDAYVFFAWLGGARNRTSVMPFLRRMASSTAETSQRRAMTAAMPANEWLSFAKDYLDQRIQDGQGASIHSSPIFIDSFSWDSSRVQTLNPLPFVLQRADLSLHCGRWRMTTRPSAYAITANGETTWSLFPTSINAMNGSAQEFRFVSMATSLTNAPQQIIGNQEATCQPCAGSREIDRCLVGRWDMTVDGVSEFMRVHVPSVRLTPPSLSSNAMTLNEDGSFIQGSSQASARAAPVVSGTTVSATGRHGGVTGNWSVASGRFTMCPRPGAVTGTVKVKTPGRTLNLAFPRVAFQNITRGYSCSGNTLRVMMPMGGTDVATSVFVRASEAR